MPYDPSKVYGGSSSKKKKSGQRSSSERLEMAQDGLLEKLGAILDSDAPATDKMGAATGALAQGVSESPLMSVLSMLNKPGVAVRIAGKQLGEGVGTALGIGTPDGRSGLDALVKGWGEGEFGGDAIVRDWNRDLGTGDLVEENPLFDGLDNSTAGEWTKRGLGLVGDIATDPLTYLAPQAKISSLGKKGVAKIAFDLAKDETDDAARLALNTIGQKASKGVSTLTDEELKLLSKQGMAKGLLDEELTGGWYFNKPGTGHVAQRIGRTFGKDIELQQARIGSFRGNAPAKAFRGAEEKLRASKLGQGASKALVEAQKAELTNLVRRSKDPELARGAFVGLEGGQVGRAKEAQLLAYRHDQLYTIHRLSDQAGISGETIMDALAGNVAARDAITNASPELWTKVQQYADEGVSKTHEFATDALRAVNGPNVPDQEFLAYRPYWAPGFRSDDLKEILDASGNGSKVGQTFGPAPIEKQARIVGGGEFMGEQLMYADATMKKEIIDHAIAKGVDPAEVKRLDSIPIDPHGRDPRVQAQEIYDAARRDLGEDPVALFEKDFFKAAEMNDRLVARRLHGHIMQEHMLINGVGEKVWSQIPTASSQAAVNKSQRLRQLLAQRKLLAAQKAQDLFDANAEASAAKQGVRDAAQGYAYDPATAQNLKTVLQQQQAAEARRVAAVQRRKTMDFLIDQSKSYLEPKIEAAADAVQASADEVTGLETRIGRLQDLQDEAGQKIARGKQAAEERIARQGERLDLEAQAADAGRQADNLTKNRARTVRNATKNVDDSAAQAKETLVKVQQVLRGEESHLRRLELIDGIRGHDEAGRVLRSEALAKYGLTEAELKAELKAARESVAKGRRFKQVLQAKAGKAGPTTAEAAAEVNAKIAAKRAEADRLIAKAEAMGDDKLARSLAELRSQLVEVSEGGSLVNPEATRLLERFEVDSFDELPEEAKQFIDVWYHGTSTGVNAFAQEVRAGFTGSYDALYGMHLTSRPGVGERYAEWSMENAILSGKTRGRLPTVGEYDVFVSNPLHIYPESLGPEAAGLSDQELAAFREFYERRALNADAIFLGLDNGTITIDDLSQGADDIAELFDRAYELYDEAVLALEAQGLDSVGAARNALVAAAEDLWGANSSPNFTRKTVDDLLYTWLSPAERKSTREVTNLGADAIQRLADDHVEYLKGLGYDGIQYNGIDGSHAVIAFDPEQVRVRDVGTLKFDPADMQRGGDGYGIPRNRSRNIDVPDGRGGRERIEVRGRRTSAYDAWDQEKRLKKKLVGEATEKARIAHKQLGSEIDRTGWRLEDAQDLLQHNQDQLNRLQDRLQQEVTTFTGVQQQAMRDEWAARLRIQQMLTTADQIRLNHFQTAQSNMDQAIQRSLQAQAQADAAAIAYGKAQGKVLQVEQAVKQLGNPQLNMVWKHHLQHNWQQIGKDFALPGELADAVTAGMKVFDDAERGAFLKSIDWITNLFKSYAVLSPGFHFRNYFSGLFNNWLAGIEPGAYERFFKADWRYTQAIKKGATHEDAIKAIAAKPIRGVDVDKLAQSYDNMTKGGILGPGGQSSEVGSVLHGGTPISKMGDVWQGPKVHPTNNPLTRTNYFAMGKVERGLRGSLALDVIYQGGADPRSTTAAMEKVFQFHFDYDDLSRFEKKVMKRVAPFYTWSRKNVPLQLEMLLTNPKPYVRYYQLKHNLELGTEEESIVPSWFGEQMAIRTPFGNDETGLMYFMPDLPFKDLNDLTDPGATLGSINPILKTPLEMKFGKQLYTDIPFKEGMVEVPESWNTLGLGKAMSALGLARQDKDGTLKARDADLYFIEQYLPLMGRLRRMFPSEEKYSDRFGTTMLSTMFGIGTRTNTKSDQASELRRRTEELDKKAADMRSLGYGGYYEFENLVKQTEKGQSSSSSSRTPTATKLKYGSSSKSKKKKSTSSTRRRRVSNVELQRMMESVR